MECFLVLIFFLNLNLDETEYDARNPTPSMEHVLINDVAVTIPLVVVTRTNPELVGNI